MPAKRKKEKREQDLAEMSDLLLEGWTQRRLGERYGVSHQQIALDAAELDRRWKAEQLTNTDTRKLRRHNELERIKRLALSAFEKSKLDGETLHAETTKGRTTKDGVPLPDQVKTTKTIRGQAGDAALLEKYLKAVIEQAKLWGDYAPQKFAVDLHKLAEEVEEMTDEELRAVVSGRTGGASEEAAGAGGGEAAGDGGSGTDDAGTPPD